MKPVLPIILILISTQALAGSQVYIRDYAYQATEYDSRYTSRINAIDGVKRELVEELGTYINSVMTIEEDELGNQYAKHDYVTLTAGITSLKLLEEDWNRIRFYVKASLEADPDEVAQQVKALRENYQVEEQLRESLQELQASRKQIEKLQQQLSAALTSNADPKNIEGLNRDYLKAVQSSEFQLAFQQAMKQLLLEDNFTQAFTSIERLAQQGHTKAMQKLGVLYQQGLGVAVDYDKARYWYQKAIDAGEKIALRNMGYLHERGLGVAQDFARAADLYNQAIQQGSAQAKANLGWLYEQGAGVHRDLEKALELYQSSVAQEPSGYAYSRLGSMYIKGEVVPINYELAQDYFSKGVELGNARSMAELGSLYMKGQGVEKDYTRALELLRRAERRSNPLGIGLLGVMYLKGFGVESNEHLAFEKFQRSAKLGSRHGMTMLGIAYKKGIGVGKNKKLARQWLQRATDQGSQKARDILCKMPGGC